MNVPTTAAHVGVLGHTVEGAALCWTEISRHSARLGHREHPDLTMDCISFERVMPAWDAGDLSTVRSVLFTSADRLAKAGAEFFVCPDNTAHLALEAAGPAFPLPGLHIVDVVAEAAQSAGYQRVGILGTRFTMNGPLYPRELNDRGIAAVLPTAAERERIDESIFTELVLGTVSASVRTAFHGIAERLKEEEGCDAIAAVCTEIPLAIDSSTSPIPVLDSTRLLGRAAAEVAHGLRPLPVWRGGSFR